jgi:hypothetical protein
MQREQYDRLIELRALGARVDHEILEQASAQYAALTISSVKGACRIRDVHDLPEGGTGFEALVHMKVSDNVPIMKIQEVRVSLFSKPISLITCAAEGFYRSLDQRHYPIDPHDVLNPKLHSGARLFPGDEAEGWLLGFGLDPIPTEYSSGEEGRAALSVLVSHNRDYKFTFPLVVIRSEATATSQQRRSRRGSLISPSRSVPEN